MLIEKDVKIIAQIVAKEKNFVVCGVDLVKYIFRQLAKDIKITAAVKDGDFLRKKSLICTISGPAQAILKGERTALNFLGRLSGIATKTNKLLSKVRKCKVKILDTRKTTPGLRGLEKFAVRLGGGYNHRYGLFDQVLIKDNHIKILRIGTPDLSLNGIIRQVKKKLKPKKLIEVEVSSLKEFKMVLPAAPDIMMLDNMSLRLIRKAVHLKNLINKKVKLEASGNISKRNIKNIAKSGVDFISIGQLTHSVDNIDFGLYVKRLF